MGLIKPGQPLPASVLTVGLAGVSADAGGRTARRGSAKNRNCCERRPSSPRYAMNSSNAYVIMDGDIRQSGARA